MVMAGSAKVRITPPIGIPLDGYSSRKEGSRGVHDDLHARALILSDGKEYIALASLELLYSPYNVTQKVRKILYDELGIPEDNVLIAAVHTHSGPSVMGFHSVRRNYFVKEYLSLLPGLVASAFFKAYKSLRKASLGYGKGEVKGWTINRRKPLKGPLDNELIVLKVESNEGSTICSVVNFTCHAVVLGANNLLISADYPGYVSETVERVEGGTCLFFNGACGDINPLTPGTIIERVYDRSVGTFTDVIKMGRSIAGEAIKVLNSLRLKEDVVLKALKREIHLKLRIPPLPSDSEIEEMKKEYESLLKEGKIKEAEGLGHKIARLMYAKNVLKMHPEGELKTELQAIRIGGLICVGIPGEPFVEIGLRIKSSSKADLTMIIGYANDVIGYIPTAEAYDEGGYEVTFPVCIVERNSADVIVREALDMIETLLST